MNYQNKTCCVIDNGLFVEFALRLAREFGRVLYFAPWTSGYPTSRARRIGSGVKQLERIDDIWDHYDDVDIWVFPDVYESGLQKHLVSQGKRVWGCVGSAWLEIDRAKSKKALAKAGLDVGPWERIVGMENLREFLKSNDDQYVKISATRGDMETFHAPTYEQVEPRLEEIEHTLSAHTKEMEFIVEQAIRPAIETGYDGYCIDGQFPDGAMVGVEVKDKAYILKTTTYDQLPGSVRRVNDGIAPILRKEGHRGFLSTEVRVTPEGRAYLIDPCQRLGSPPSELYQELIANLADIIWHGSEGVLVEPIFNAKWGAEVLLLSDWADKNWQHVKFPKSIRNNVKLRNFCIIDGEHYVVPQSSGMPEIGAVVAMGNTPQEAIDECKRIAKLVDGYSIEAPVEAIDEAYEQLRETLKAAKADDGDRKPKVSGKAKRAMEMGLVSETALKRAATRR